MHLTIRNCTGKWKDDIKKKNLRIEMKMLKHIPCRSSKCLLPR